MWFQITNLGSIEIGWHYDSGDKTFESGRVAIFPQTDFRRRKIICSAQNLYQRVQQRYLPLHASSRDSSAYYVWPNECWNNNLAIVRVSWQCFAKCFILCYRSLSSSMMQMSLIILVLSENSRVFLEQQCTVCRYCGQLKFICCLYHKC